MKRAVLDGLRFGRLVVRRWHTLRGNARPASPGSKGAWLCECDCGGLKLASSAHLAGGRVISCGCSRVASAGDRIKPKRPSEYNSWFNIIQRCENPSHPAYPAYGGRGIGVCARWRASYADFFADVGPKPSPSHSIDRIDNDRGYEPGNCRWATKEQQSQNRSSSRLSLALAGEIRTKAAAGASQRRLASEIGVSRSTIRRAIRGASWAGTDGTDTTETA